jgi:hypothetical protein
MLYCEYPTLKDRGLRQHAFSHTLLNHGIHRIKVGNALNPDQNFTKGAERRATDQCEALSE